MEDLSRYNQNFSHELTEVNDRINVHLNILFLELQDIYTAMYIFRTVDSEWNKKVQKKNHQTTRQLEPFFMKLSYTE